MIYLSRLFLVIITLGVAKIMCFKQAYLAILPRLFTLSYITFSLRKTIVSVIKFPNKISQCDIYFRRSVNLQGTI